MIDHEQIQFILNHHFFIPAFAIGTFLLFLLAVTIFIFVPGPPQYPENQEEGGKIGPGKKKKTKKQKSTQEKKAADSPKVKKESTKNGVDSLTETSTRGTEEVKQEKKREGKSKTKSKKKKNTQVKTEGENVPEAAYEEIMDGEWQTVSTKEQREQMKREKKKQEETVALETEKSDPVPLVQPSIKISAGIPAIAKGIAPRFAKAAGEPWQGKESSTGGSHMPSKRPMPPVTIPGTGNQQTKSSAGDQGWMSKSQIITSPWSGPDNALLSMPPPSDNNATPSWTQSPGNWPQQMLSAKDITGQQQQRITAKCGNNHRMSAEEWVKIATDGQNGRTIAVNTESWVNGTSPVQPQNIENGVERKGDQWVLEPEGVSVEPPPLDPSDPWNFEFVETSEDWAAPVSTWDNTTDEWTAPVPVKSEPTYFDESSDDNKTSLKTANAQQPLVPGQSKKSKRRRKKKQAAASEPEQVTSISPNSEEVKKSQETTDSGNIPVKTEEAKIPEQSIETPSAPEEPSVANEAEPVKEDWTMTKPAKKRKPKARKAD